MSESMIDRVRELFNGENYYCAETVVKLIAEAGGRNADEAVRMATGFCSGAGRTCGQCGAVSGAVMGLGLHAGRTEPGGEYESVYAMVQEFMERFRAKYRSLNCRELTGCDFATPEGQARFRDENIVTLCHEMVTFAVEESLSILRDAGYLPEADELMRSRMAPCGLMCGKCVAFADGDVRRLSQDMQALLGDNFGEYAKRFEGANPIFGHYPAFRELLDYLASGPCEGCRDASCLFKACAVPACAREHGVDYCFQCGEFPCDHHGMPERLAQIWRRNNELMRDQGVESQFRFCNDKPRYP